MQKPTSEHDGLLVAGMLLVMALLAFLLSGCCSAQAKPDGVIFVDPSSIHRCGEYWCVTDGWLAEQVQSRQEMAEDLAECLRWHE